MPENKESEKCNFDSKTHKVTLCPDMGYQLSQENAGRIFNIAYIEGSAAIICDHDKTVLYFCPFCGQKIREKTEYSRSQWK